MNSWWLQVGAVVLASLGVMACSDDAPTAPSNVAPFGQTDLRLGDGAEAVAGELVSVHYTGWFYDGSRADHKGLQFDSSAGRDPFSFTLGGGQVIEGWDRGLVGMREGGLRRLVVPPSLAYGATRNGPIPAHTTLLFEIELVRVGPEANGE